MPFAQLDQDPGKRIYEDRSRQSIIITWITKRRQREEYQSLSFQHVGALKTGDDGNIDVLTTDCVDETLCDGVAADDATLY